GYGWPQSVGDRSSRRAGGKAVEARADHHYRGTRDARDHGRCASHRGSRSRTEDCRGQSKGGRREPGGRSRLSGVRICARRRSGRNLVLALSGVTASYGTVPAVSDVSIDVGEGEAVGLLGANGAGKSTTLRAISGLVRLTSGTITF